MSIVMAVQMQSGLVSRERYIQIMESLLAVLIT